jgi:CRP/FNR family transcriptional regulator, dissimilatory nitrate respiration regulator
MPLFAGLEQRTLTRIAKGAAAVDIDTGDILFRRDDASEALYVVVSGRIKLSLPCAEDDEKVIALLGPEESFGEAAMFLGKTHIVTAQALTRSKVISVAKAAVDLSIKRDARFARQVVEMLSHRLRRLMREIENSATLTGTQRVIHFLLRELPAANGEGSETIALPAKKRIIASRLDLTHEHFSRILHDLAAQKLIVVDGPRVVVPDVARLRSYYASLYSPKESVRAA